MRQLDPDGQYYLNMVDVTYNVKGVVPATANQCKEFDSYIMIPSCSISFWNCSRRIYSLDGAHLNNMFEGVVLTMTCRDASNRCVTLAICVCRQENKRNWTNFFNCIELHFKQIRLIISDKDKRLDILRLRINCRDETTALADLPVYELCADNEYQKLAVSIAKARLLILGISFCENYR